MSRAVVLVLTAMTGFSGLVYEVGWQKYLATLLGSHSEATATVLALFLGGLSLGYQIFGRVTRRLVARAEQGGRPPRLLLFYGGLEAGIGAYVVFFPILFEWIRALSYALPHGAGGLGFAVDVALSAVLIGPPSVLMGGTIPILTQALARSLADATRFHAFVYAFNTFGAFVGALAAGFYLVPRLGLVQVMYAMGSINLAAGAIFALLGLRTRSVVDLREPVESDAPRVGLTPYALVALLVGFAMMAVQTTAIRVAGLSFGSSPFTFSVVVAVFVVCIALGSFAVSALTRIRSSWVVANQWALAVLMLALYPVLAFAPYLAQRLRAIFRDDDLAFYPYQALCFLAVLAVVGPPVVLSGASLPLLFHHLRRHAGHLGDLAGALYSWNTVGSLLGALLGGYVLFFWLDLHHIYRISVVALFAAAAILSIQVSSLRRTQVVGLLLPFLGIVFALPAWDPNVLTAGLFRERQPLFSVDPDSDGGRRLEDRLSWGNSKLVFYDDDPTTTVSVRVRPYPDGSHSVSLATGGKIDGDTKADNQTMRLIAVLPAMMADRLERSFVIGYGTGLTVGELTSFESMREVIVAEISRGVIRAAPLFDRENRGASVDSKVEIVNSDAYRALMRSEGQFDVIVSEPSNPWVTGVEMLFSREFLEVAKARLTPGGVHAQWIHQYEIDDASLALVLRTYASVFEHVSVWTAHSYDLVLLGFKGAGSGIDHYRLRQRAGERRFAESLARSGVSGFAALLAHELLPLGVIHAANLEGPVHTLLHPRLNDMAGRAFFRNAVAHPPPTSFGEAARTGAKHSMLRGYAATLGGRLPDDERAELVAEACRYRAATCRVLLAAWQHEDPESPALRRVLSRGERSVSVASDDHRLAEIASLFPGAAPSRDGVVTPEAAKRATEVFRSHYYHGAPFDAHNLVDVWSRCREEVITSFASCEDDLARAREQSPLEEEAALRARLPSCSDRKVIGQTCQEGLSRAQQMVQH